MLEESGREASEPRRRCVVVDDEPLARRCLVALLERHHPFITVAGECDSVEGAIVLIAGTRPDLVFLDIEIIGGSGFDVLDRFPDPFFDTIITTAYVAHRSTARPYPRTRFLLKPIDLLELRKAME
jgi:two-component system LytT family response regulator